MIANCGSNEFGSGYGGQAGDQTGNEYRVRTWYSRPWKCVLRYPDLQKAIDSQDIVKSIYGSYKDDNDRVQNMLGILMDHTYGEDYKMDLLMSYVAKRSIEKSYEEDII